MSIFFCQHCDSQVDSDFEGIINHNNSEWCDSCFTEEFQCEDCGGFKDKFAMASYDGQLCEC